MKSLLGKLRERAGSGDLIGRLVMLAAVWIVFGILDPGFINSDSVFSVLLAFAFLGLITLGIGVTMIAGELDLSAASVAAVAGILAVKFSGIGIYPAILLAALIGAAWGAFQGSIIARLRINSVVFTIGTLFALRGVANLLTDGQAVLLPVDKLDASDGLIERLWVFSPFALITIGVMVMVGCVLARTKWGREIYAIGGARPESVTAGVPQRRPLILAFAISGFTAGLAGAIASIIAGSGAAQAYESVLLLAVTAALIGGIGLYGGRGTVLNIAIGALIIQSFTAGLTNQGATEDIQQLATGGLLLLTIVVEFFVIKDPNRITPIARWRARRRLASWAGEHDLQKASLAKETK